MNLYDHQNSAIDKVADTGSPVLPYDDIPSFSDQL